MTEPSFTPQDAEDLSHIKAYATALAVSHQSMVSVVDIAPRDGNISLQEWLDAARLNPEIAEAIRSDTLCTTEGRTTLDRWTDHLTAQFPLLASETRRKELIALKLDDVWNLDAYRELDARYHATFAQAASLLRAKGITEITLPTPFSPLLCSIGDSRQLSVPAK